MLAADQQQRRARHSAKQQAHSDANARYCSDWLAHGETPAAPADDPVALEDETDLTVRLQPNDEFAASFSAWGNSLHDRGGWGSNLGVSSSSTPRDMSCRTDAQCSHSHSVGPLARQRSLDVALDAVTASFRESLQLSGRHPQQRRNTRRSLDVQLLDHHSSTLTELPESETTWSSSNNHINDSELLGSGGLPASAASQRHSARSSLDVLLDKAELPQHLLAPPVVHSSGSIIHRSCSSRDFVGSGGGGGAEPLRHYHSLTVARRGAAHVSMDALMEHAEAP